MLILEQNQRSVWRGRRDFVVSRIVEQIKGYRHFLSNSPECATWSSPHQSSVVFSGHHANHVGVTLLCVCLSTLSVSVAYADDARKLDLPTVAFMAGATADWVTTHRNLSTPPIISADGLYRTEFYEANPLLGWAADKPVLMYAVAAGLDAGGVYAWYRLTTNHRKIRAVGLYAAAAARFAIAYRNHHRREQFLKGRAF